MANQTLTPEVRDVLERSTITADSVTLPEQLERKLYEQVNYVLTNAGGAWNRKEKSHVFKGDPRVKLGLTLETGVSLDEQKQFQAFYTPSDLAVQVVGLANVKGKRVLEPSAGDGALVSQCIAQGASDVECIELNPENRDVLVALCPAGKKYGKKYSVTVAIGDFLQAAPEPFDRIVMNPPFTRNQDIAHVEHALKFLADAGILVAIMSDNQDRPLFKAMLARFDREIDNVNYSIQKVPERTFKDTPIKTIILTVKFKNVMDKILDNPKTPAAAPMVTIIQGVPPTGNPEPIPPAPEPDMTVEAKSAMGTTWDSGKTPLTEVTETEKTDVDHQPDQIMKLTIPRRDLVAALADVKSAPTTFAKEPIMANVLLTATDGTLTLTGTDGDITLRRRVDATVKDPGKTTVRAALLYDIARGADADHVTLNLSRKTLHVECGSVKFQLNTLDPDDFPPFSRLKEPVEFSLEQHTLRSMLARTRFAAGSDTEKRLILTGSMIKVNGDLCVAAFDGRRLAVVTNEVPKGVKAKVQIVVPGKCTRELLRLLDIEADEKEPSLVEVSVSKSHIQLTLGENTVLSRLVEGDYPDFKKIIPDILPLTNIGRVDLLRAVERIALVGDGVILEFQKQSLHLRSTRVVTDQADFFGEASDALLCASSKEATLTLSCNHLIEALNASQADQIDFFIKDRIAMIKSKDENWTAIISGMAVKKEEK